MADAFPWRPDRASNSAVKTPVGATAKSRNAKKNKIVAGSSFDNDKDVLAGQVAGIIGLSGVSCMVGLFVAGVSHADPVTISVAAAGAWSIRNVVKDGFKRASGDTKKSLAVSGALATAITFATTAAITGIKEASGADVALPVLFGFATLTATSVLIAHRYRANQGKLL